MNARANGVLIFVAGAVAGFSVAALLFHTKRDDNNQNETIDKKQQDDDVQTYIVVQTIDENETSTENLIKERYRYDQVLKNYGYSDVVEPKEKEPTKSDPIHEIDEEEYFEVAQTGYYDLESYILYGDGVIAHSVTDEVISEPTALNKLGSFGTVDFLREHFAKTSDPLYIRNSNTFTQYEILFDDRPFREVVGW